MVLLNRRTRIRMDKLKEVIAGNSIIIAVVGASLLAILLPGPGQYLNQFNLISPLILIVFFCQGTGVKPIQSAQFKQYFTILLIGFITSQIAAPILGYYCAKSFNWQGDSFVGFILIFFFEMKLREFAPRIMAPKRIWKLANCFSFVYLIFIK